MDVETGGRFGLAEADSDVKKRIGNPLITGYLFKFGKGSEFLKILAAVGVAGFFLTLILGELWFLGVVIGICAAGGSLTIYLAAWLLSRDDGTPAMRKVSDPIREGAEGFLAVQYSTIKKMALILSGLIFFSNIMLGDFKSGFVSVFTFLSGAFCSAFAGYLSMWVSSHTNIRVASAAQRSYSQAFYVCFRGGAFSAILALTLCVTGVTFLYTLFYVLGSSPDEIPRQMTGYGFGASFVALFMQLGGGIYTKAADVGADLVGKVEVGIPEDDPRNPAVIADLVGDMVGDCVGSSADVFESVASEILGSMILGASLANHANLENPLRFAFFPVIVHSFDIIVSSIGILSVKVDKKDDEDCLQGKNVNPMTPLKRGYSVSLVLATIGFIFASRSLLHVEAAPSAWLHFLGCGFVGMATSYVFILSTQYYTDYAYSPVRQIAQASTSGHGVNIITGVAIGFKSTFIPAIAISFAVLFSYYLGRTSGLGDLGDGNGAHESGLFGTAVATMGLLSSAGYVLAQNNFGPVADNAGGIAEMSGQPEQVRVTTDKLDAAGNVTKAITKGYSVGSAALACIILFGAFLDEYSTMGGISHVDLIKPELVVAGLLGMSEIFLIVGMAINAVGVAAAEVVAEVRRQLKESPGILQWTVKPNYKACVEIVTRASLKQMQLPGIIAVAMPTGVGLIFRFIGSYTDQPMLGAECVASYMIFATVSGILLALFLDNVGGAWDNAKKYVELGNHGGKGSEAHKAAVTGDTVGDPFKDTAGPAIHVVIKLLGNTVLVLAPIFISQKSI